MSQKLQIQFCMGSGGLGPNSYIVFDNSGPKGKIARVKSQP